MPKTQWGIKILVSVFFVGLILVIGGALTSLGLTSWYQTLVLPSYTPAGNIIGLVWTTLYILLAGAIFLSWSKEGDAFFNSLGPLYLTNGLLNLLWSFVFFYMHDLTGAFVTAVLLAFSVLVLVLGNFKVSKLAAGLLVPYLLWVCFATVLNANIALLNN